MTFEEVLESKIERSFCCYNVSFFKGIEKIYTYRENRSYSTHLEDILNNRGRAINFLYRFEAFTKGEINWHEIKDLPDFEERFNSITEIKAALFIELGNDFTVEKSYELTKVFQNSIEQLVSLNKEFVALKKRVPNLPEEKIQEKIVLKDAYLNYLLSSNIITSPIQYHLQISIVDINEKPIFSTKKVFKTENSIINRHRAFSFLSGIYSGLNISSPFLNEPINNEPSNNEEIIYVNQNCFIKREILIGKMAEDGSVTQIAVLRNSFKKRKEIYIELEKELNLYKKLDINVPIVEKRISNDFLEFDVERRIPRTHSYVKVIAWHIRADSIYKVITPCELVISGNLVE